MGITQRYFIYLSYNGKNYHGWQTQPNAVSVQEVLEKCLSTVLSEPISITGAGRTDTGVHAELMVAHFDTNTTIESPILLTGKLNSFLPKDIAIQKITAVTPEAHARFDALSRTYEYRITSHKNPFLKDFAYQLSGILDVEAMNKAAQTLFDYSDFTSFSKLHTDAKTNICKIMQAQWSQRDEILIFTIQADRFLRNMVRAIVGTLVEVGKGKMTIDEFRAIIEKKDRCSAGISMSEQGLFLVNIEYPKNIFIE
jgi:tRNA pseudouridine38-40 synthase